MGKNIRRGRTGNVRCASCGQITRRDRAVYLFRDGIKAYYCPDCAKKVHGKRLYKGMPKYVKKAAPSKVKRKFTVFASENSSGDVAPSEPVDKEGASINLSKEDSETKGIEESKEEKAEIVADSEEEQRKENEGNGNQ